jgi:hypothetical protein
MLGRTHDPKITAKTASRTAANAAAKTATALMPLTVQRFQRECLWGAAMLAALLIAVLAAQSDVGAHRAAHILASLNTSPEAAAHAFDAEAAARQLTQAVRTLALDRDRLALRLAAVERDMDDLTGSIKQQGDAGKTSQSGSAWPIDAPPVPMTPADISAMVKSAAPPASRLAAVGAPATTDTTAADSTAALPAYGADIGSATSMKTLQTRWTALRAAHPQLFDGMHPVVALRQNAHLNHTELHLVVGPYSSADAAAQFCGLLATFHVPCQPTMFDDRHLALQ